MPFTETLSDTPETPCAAATVPDFVHGHNHSPEPGWGLTITQWVLEGWEGQKWWPMCEADERGPWLWGTSGCWLQLCLAVG